MLRHCVRCFVFSIALLLAGSGVHAELVHPQGKGLVLIEPGPATQVVYRADGRAQQLPTETVWRYMCGSDTSKVTLDDLRRTVETARRLERETAQPATPAAETAGGGLNIVWVGFSGMSQQARDAVEVVAQYIEKQFSDNVTVSINVQMFNFGSPNVIGSTGSNYTSAPTYATARDGLIAGMDGDDVVHDHLPTTTTIPVRYDASTATITNETRVFVTIANFNAALGSAGGSAASMQFNTQFPFDFDPSDGITGGMMDFQSVVAHEVGHALGFVSGVDFRTNDMEMLDLFRFQRTDGAGDYNPDTLDEFQAAPRTLDFNNLNNDANSDVISAEYRMSDGDPSQASHFQDNLGIGIMDPTLAFGQSFFPEFYLTADRDMFDAIGWDYTDCNRNDRADSLDLADGISQDCNVNLLPDECEVSTADPLQKNRYLTYFPGAPGCSAGIHVTLFSLPLFSSHNGETRRVGSALPHPDVHAGETFVAAQLQCDPHFQVWPTTLEPIHIFGTEIVPFSAYDVRFAPDGCTDVACMSPPIRYQTARWADVAAPYGAGQPNFGDIAALVDAFQSASGSIGKPLAQLQANVVNPDAPISFQEISKAVDAFQGDPYPFAGPTSCP